MTKFILAIGFGLLFAIVVPEKGALAHDDRAVAASIAVGPGEQLGINLLLTSPVAKCAVVADLRFSFPNDPSRTAIVDSFELSNDTSFFTTVKRFDLVRGELRLPVVVELMFREVSYLGTGRCRLATSWDLRGPKGETRNIERAIEFDLHGVFERPVAAD